MHYFSNLFDNVLYTIRTGPLSITKSISTLYTRIFITEFFVLLTVHFCIIFFK
jgi:hypothetical protein